jgi:hypothetical protein
LLLPPDKQKAVLEAGVVDVLSSVYTKFAGGGGVAKIDVNQVLLEMNGLAGTDPSPNSVSTKCNI